MLDTRVRFAHTEDGHRLALTEVAAGSGRFSSAPPVLLIHGFAQNRRAFLDGPLPDLLLSRGMAVFVGELRGHGLSRADLMGRPFGGRRTLRDHLALDLPALIKRVLEVTGAAQVHYMGHSMGGLVGLACLPRSPPFASLTAWATPLRLGASRPSVGLASRAVHPILGLLGGLGAHGSVPMRALLGAVSGVATHAAPSGPRRAFGRWLGLTNPDLAPRDALRRVLSQGEDESSQIMRELSELTATARPTLCGVDLVEALHGWPGRVAFVVGSRDIFAAPLSVAPALSLDQAGARRVFVIREGHHVDVAMGRPVVDLFHELATFIGA